MEPRQARRLATRLLIDLSPRWQHVQGVGVVAERLLRGRAITPGLTSAAWLHDVGYATKLRRTGFHPLDGALFLQHVGAPESVTSLVAYHTGAATEARLRGLEDKLAGIDKPDPADLDVLTLLDMSIGPDGHPIEPVGRISEVLNRYAPDDPVHRAREQDTDVLLAAVDRARRRIGPALDRALHESTAT